MCMCEEGGGGGGSVAVGRTVKPVLLCAEGHGVGRTVKPVLLCVKDGVGGL